MKKQLLLLSISIPLLFNSCETKTQQTQNVNVGQDDSSRQETKEVNNTTNEAAKTKEEVYAETGLAVGEIVLDKIKEKWKRDSIELSNRGKVLVYQIGVPKSDKDELWNSYSKIRNIPGIYAFREGDNYYLIKVANYSEQGMQDSLAITSDALAQIGMNENISVLNIMSFCKRKETITHGKKVKIKHQDDIPCYVCN